MPEQEIWVKLGGDKGGSSTKISFQILNVLKPNSVSNTTVFAAFAAQDTSANLNISLHPFQDQIQDLQENKWM